MLLPVNISLLRDILTILASITYGKYELYLTKATLVFAYYFCLRAGETVKANADTHTSRREQLTVNGENHERSITIKFTSYKHCYKPSASLTIASVLNSPFCPVKIIMDYLRSNQSNIMLAQ